MKAGWETSTLGEACELLNRGISPKYLESGGIQVLNQKCVRDHKVDFTFARRHDSHVKKVSEERLLRAGDVLINSTGTGTLGRVAQLRSASSEPATVDSHVTIARPKQEKFHPDYFGYLLIGIEDQIKQAGEGTSGQTELARSVLANNFTIQYPTSTSEQQRIAGILDKVFAAIAAARANVEKQLSNSQKILERNVENSLMEQGWEMTKLGELCEGVDYGSSTKSVETGRVPVLRMGNVQNGAIDWSNLVYTNDEREINKYSLNHDDVLFNRTNSAELVGKTAIYKNDMPAIFAGYLIRIRRKKAVLNADYLNYYLNSTFARSYGKTVMSSSVHQANINGSKLKNYPIPTPPLAEQQKLVEKFDELKQSTQALSRVYRQKLAVLDDLKQSLLAEAFFGD